MEDGRVKYSLILTFKCNDPLLISDVLKRLDIKIKDRVSYDVKNSLGEVIISLKAKDVTALRTAINAILRNLKVAEDAMAIK